jgi:hypothetical protein
MSTTCRLRCAQQTEPEVIIPETWYRPVAQQARGALFCRHDDAFFPLNLPFARNAPMDI